jgi:hypothetical protein
MVVGWIKIRIQKRVNKPARLLSHQCSQETGLETKLSVRFCWFKGGVAHCLCHLEVSGQLTGRPASCLVLLAKQSICFFFFFSNTRPESIVNIIRTFFSKVPLLEPGPYSNIVGLSGIDIVTYVYYANRDSIQSLFVGLQIQGSRTRRFSRSLQVCPIYMFAWCALEISIYTSGS